MMHDDAMGEVIGRLLCSTLADAGLLKGPRVVLAERLPPFYLRWCRESIRLLDKRGYLSRDASGGFEPAGSAGDVRRSWEEWSQQKEAWQRDPNLRPKVELAERCLRALPEILAGRRAATEVLFPDGSMDLLEKIYRGNPFADGLNAVLSGVVSGYLQVRLAASPDARIRILEVGAGTGSTAAAVLEALGGYEGHVEEYCYTDVSLAFLQRAQKTLLAEVAQATTRRFDIERRPEEQDIRVGAYDVVIGSNVVHATRDVRQALQNVKATLKRNGLLLLNELGVHSIFNHVSFGLLEAWWRYEDPELRMPGGPGMSCETWMMVLEEEGFCQAWSPNADDHGSGQMILVAESDGVVGFGARGQREPATVPPSGPPRQASARLERGEAADGGVSPRTTDPSRAARTIVRCLADALEVEPARIDGDQPFSDYGVDSIVGVDVVRRINGAFGIDLMTAILFEHSTVHRLARHVAELSSAVAHEPPAKAVAPAAAAEGAVPGSPEPVPVQAPGLGRSMLRQWKRAVAETTAAFEAHSGSPSAPMAAGGRAAAPLEPRDARGAAPNPAGVRRRREIAVIGMSGKFPKAPTPEAFWRNLVEGVDGLGELPRHYLDPEADFSPERQPGKSRSKWAGVLEDRDCFDPQFFKISPREAQSMSPHQRLILQESWKAIEDAGCDPRGLSGAAVSMFVGCEPTGYFYETFTGYSDALVASRLSYHLDLKGPAMVINTGCSSSALAIHLACESLDRGESDVALAGGVFAALGREALVRLSGLDIMSPAGKCSPFGKTADGTVFSEAVGVVVLKRLADAIRDEDPIYGVIEASGVNQDGASNGITAPNASAQIELLCRVYRDFGIDPEGITYLETHGTGTQLGDTVEGNALVRAFQQFTKKEKFCAVGSAKAHIGHAAAAAGVAGLIKVLLSMKHRTIPGLLHFEELNPAVKFEGSPFYVNEARREWHAGDRPLRAGLSSFGHSGTNVHLVVREHRSPASRRPVAGAPRLVPLSAKTQGSLHAHARDLVAWLRAQPAGGERADATLLADLAYTCQVGREAMDCRAAFVAQDLPDLVRQIETFVSEREPERPARQPGSNGLAEILGSGVETAPLVEAWARQGRLDKIGKLWGEGLGVDFSLLYERERPRRIHVPPYAFAEERYGLPEPAGAPAQRAPDALQPVVPDGSEVMCFEERWEPRPLAAGGRPPETLVCVLSGEEHQRTFLEMLAAESPETRVVFVESGAASGSPSPTRYRVAADDPESYEKAFLAIARAFSRVDGVLHLGAVEEPRCVEDPAELVLLLQAIARTQCRPRRILLAGAHGSALQRCHVESWIGLVRSVPMTMADTCASVVLRERGDEPVATAIAEWSRLLLGELRSADLESAKYENGERRVLRVRPFRPTPAPSLLAPSRTYLITGGCGGLGRIFAGYLAKLASVRLVLTGRSALGEETGRFLATLEKGGAEVLYVRADVSNANAMRRGLDEARRRFGPIRGVLHCAGVESRHGLMEKTVSELKSVLSPKVAGTLVLDELLAGDPLDFLCYFSSSSAVLGDFGGGDYAMANRFLKAHAAVRETRRREGGCCGRTVAIEWPAWRHGGMQVGDEDAARLYLTSSKQRFLETNEGLLAFERIIAGDKAHALVMAGERGRVERFLGVEGGRPAAAEPADGDIEARLLADLTAAASRCLGLAAERLDADRNLADFGFDSVNLVDFARQVSQRLSIDLAPSVFFAHSTLRRLGQHCMKAHAAALKDGHAGVRMPDATAPARARPDDAVKEAVPAHDLAPEPPASAAPTTSKATFEPIAILGMSGRFAGARNVEEMWRILAGSQGAVTELPSERLGWRINRTAATRAASARPWSGCIPGVQEFDPLFFEISPYEAEQMDPRQRHLLQESWNALEDAGYGPQQLASKRIGFFAGAEEGDYQALVGEGSVTSSHNALMAARLCYFLDLHGPAMTINTSCSSGLVAVHLACMSLHRGECDTAIAAAAHLSLSLDGYAHLTEAGMLAPGGRCFAFDQRANGLVPGEAIAAVVLKPLRLALADRDPIHAVIRATGINYDGRTIGITAPNGSAQSELIASMYETHGIDPREIGHLIAHGTGTKLGDPVEVQALQDAFERLAAKLSREPRDDWQCALTSTKPTFGHSFAASGLVSLVAMVQSIERGEIPPSLHYEHGNELIQWTRGPFRVNERLRRWEGDGASPRVGALSAFGMSGTNAHAVLQSPPPAPPRSVRGAPYSLVVLSAKTPAALEERKRALLDALEATSREWSLSDVSYTLLHGRHHFRHRAALVVQSIDEAIALLAGGGQAPVLFHSEANPALAADAPVSARIRDRLREAGSLPREGAGFRAILSELAELYCQGHVVSSPALFGEPPPRGVHLPGYPFARRHCWLSGPSTTRADGSFTLEPDAEAAPPAEARFAVWLSGGELFLDDHRVNGERVVPGVASLEMARAAVEQAWNAKGMDGSRVRLEDVVWPCPITVPDGGRRLVIRVLEGRERALHYEIRDGGEPGGDRLYSAGSARVAPEWQSLRHDLPALRARLSDKTADIDEHYRAFARRGIAYGPAYRVVEEMFAGPEGVLARLVLPAEIAASRGAFGLHPALVDAALQTAIALDQGRDAAMARDAAELALPFAVDQVDVMGAPGELTWSWMRRAGGAERATRKVDVDLCNERGEVWASLRGFSVRAAELAPARAARDDAAAFEGARTNDGGAASVHIASPVWNPAFGLARDTLTPRPGRTVLVCGATEQRARAIRRLYPHMTLLSSRSGHGEPSLEAQLASFETIDHIVWIAADAGAESVTDESLVEGQEHGVMDLFRTIKAALGAGYASRPLGWTVVVTQTQRVQASDSIRPAHASVIGLAGSLAKEYANWTVRVVDLQADREWPVRDVFALPASERGDVLACRDGQWFRQEWAAVDAAPRGPAPCRPGGLHVVIGGAGGLGDVWSRFVVRRHAGRVVWIGRRPKDAAIQRRIDAISKLGPAPEYIAADAADRRSLEDAYARIRREHGPISGLVHSALVLSDRSLAGMDEERFRASLRAKVDVCVRMAQVFEAEELDFVLFFSSLQSFAKSAGQSNYAAGCTFKDAFAARLAQQWRCPVKLMNWGYWGSVGVVADDAHRARMAKANVGSIEPEEGMQGLDVLLQERWNQIALYKTVDGRPLADLAPAESLGVHSDPLAVGLDDLAGLFGSGPSRRVLEARAPRG